MKVWITSFLIVFGAAELFQWFKQLTLPLPIFVVAGAFLAIVSNTDKVLPFGLNQYFRSQTKVTPPPASPPDLEPLIVPPVVPPPVDPTRPISFEIKKKPRKVKPPAEEVS